ncbi:MAG: glutaredoxin [Hyphomicrobiales bacterium]|nr:glutaredoxin [Hyphomicrobiales bacterium]
MTKIEIFTRPGCGYCLAAKQLLVGRKLSYTEFDLSVPEHQEELSKRHPQAKTVPQIFVGKQLIGGFDDLNRELSRR